ncbi:hypothetical protein ABT160_11835 [Streptomyces sp. NPDC001941]|uniref:hypothetical protein n=1 Tax=Streptomyces sp. NPDC001941 TaxID=3154659 RepID=UPI00333299FA
MRHIWIGFLALALLPLTATAAHGADCSGDFAARLSCWGDRTGDGAPLVVTLRDPLATGGKPSDWQLAERKAAFARGPLVVLAPGRGPTGEGGTLLLALAGERLVDPGAEVTRLRPDALAALRAAGGCSAALCTLLAAPQQGAAARKPLRGSDMIAAKAADDIGPGTDAFGTDEQPFPWATALLVAVLLVLLVLLFAVVRRSRAPRPALAAAAHPGGPVPAARRAPAPAPPAARPPSGAAPRGPTRTAVVRTALRPQGYVELDHSLYRAVWTAPGAPPPDPGEPVEVSGTHDRDPAVLQAHPQTRQETP